MAANTSPISPIAPATAYITSGTSANTALDGTGTVATVYTAGANGSRVDRLRIMHMGTNIASVLRVFINNGSTNATAGNNALISEVTMAANTLSQVAAATITDLPLNIVLKSGYKINVTTGTAVASGYMVTAIAGDY
jgi:hypothetical protein